MHFINVNAITCREKINKSMKRIDKYKKKKTDLWNDTPHTSVVIKQAFSVHVQWGIYSSLNFPECWILVNT